MQNAKCKMQIKNGRTGEVGCLTGQIGMLLVSLLTKAYPFVLSDSNPASRFCILHSKRNILPRFYDYIYESIYERTELCRIFGNARSIFTIYG